MNTWAVATLLGFLAFPQEPAPDVESLLKQAEEGSEAAEKELIRLGPAVEPALRKRMNECPRDSWIPLDRILERIDIDDRRGRIRAAAKLVSVKIDGRPLHEALIDLEKAVGAPLGWHKTLRMPVTIDVKDVSPLEALDRACASAKVSWYAQWLQGKPPTFPHLIFHGVSETAPRESVQYVKGFRIGTTGMGIQRRRTRFSDTATAWIGGLIQPSPGAGLFELDGVRIERVVDDRGSVLHEAEPPKKPAAPRPAIRLAGASSPPGHMSWGLSVKPPERDATWFSILGGVAEIRFEIERRHVALEASEAALGKSVEFEGLTLTLESFSRGEGRVMVGVTQKGRRTPAERSDAVIPFEGRRLDFAVLRLRDGSTVHAARTDSHWGPEGRVERSFVTMGEPAEIRFIAYSVWERETLPFEFREVPIPAGDR